MSEPKPADVPESEIPIDDTADYTEAEKLADELTAIAVKQYDTAVQYRQPKLDRIMKAEELYFNVVTKTLKGRFNIPIPIISGFVDSLLAKIDDEITINFDPTEEADKIKVRKVDAAWSFDSAPTRGMWAIKDILIKKLAIFSGRGIAKVFSESDPTYKSYFEIIDAFDFLAEPNGGWHLENHLFRGQENIFRTKTQLENGAQYNQKQVAKLISSVGSADYKKTADLYQNRQKRHQALGLDTETNNYVGTDLFNMIEWEMYHEGKMYYLFFDVRARTWIRCEELKELTGEPKSGELAKSMFKSWATHPDAWNFWSKAPVDDVVPVAVGLKTITNFSFDDVQKRLWGQRIYDPEFFSDPSQLEWDRPDKLIMATVPNGKTLEQGIYEFQTGDKSSVTVNLIDYMRTFIATESGITPQAKGNSDEKILGIAKINEGEVADRLGLTNKFYTQFYAECGAAYLEGLKMCMTTKMLVRMIGESGTESAELTKDDLSFSSEPDVRITGGKTEARRSEQKQEAKAAALTQAIELFPNSFNAKNAIESLLSNGHWDADEIVPLLDLTSDGNEEQSVRASQAIQDILAGKTPALYQGATTRFTQRLIDYANKTVLKDGMIAKIMQYGLAHKDIVVKNMARKAMIANLAKLGGGAPAPSNQATEPEPDEPGQGQPASVPAPQAEPVTAQ